MKKLSYSEWCDMVEHREKIVLVKGKCVLRIKPFNDFVCFVELKYRSSFGPKWVSFYNFMTEIVAFKFYESF